MKPQPLSNKLYRDTMSYFRDVEKIADALGVMSGSLIGTENILIFQAIQKKMLFLSSSFYIYCLFYFLSFPYFQDICSLFCATQSGKIQIYQRLIWNPGTLRLRFKIIDHIPIKIYCYLFFNFSLNTGFSRIQILISYSLAFLPPSLIYLFSLFVASLAEIKRITLSSSR